MSYGLGVEVRRLAEADLPGVLKIAEDAQEAPNWPRQTFVEMLSGEYGSRRVALTGIDSGSGAVLGFAVASVVLPEAELENVAVARNLRRRGIARRLLLELVDELRGAGVATLHLEVRASNSAAIGLYGSLGFVETGCRARYYSDPVEDAALMTLKLS